MFKKLMVVFTLAGALVLGGCGQRVEVPAASVGKIMTKAGYQEGIVAPSVFRLEWCWTYCDRLVIVDAADKAYGETVDIFMPKDNLILTATVNTTLSINPIRVDSLFNSLTPEAVDSQVAVIKAQSIYNTYARQIVITEAREFLSQYSISEVASSVEQVNTQLATRLSKKLIDKTPFNVRHVNIGNIKYPQIIIDAQENTARRREQIQQEEAQLEISKVTLQRELQEVQLQRKIDQEKALTEAEAQRVISQTIDTNVLKLRQIENDKAWIEKWNGELPQTVLGGGAVPMINLGVSK